ncbi:PREDICTED: uncharacterized protein LOC109178163 [Ipomoea nil]|uniref:uncharacterized protein LOC109178163 n=1 Tax=Ipomoea nil TaxID=35883 RepID=UPI000900E92E|nr:PREDICTED: uncharacterized protein LOC109178163 [Ipomoea nil]
MSRDCYVVLYTYHSHDKKEDYYLCWWIVKDSVEVNYCQLNKRIFPRRVTQSQQQTRSPIARPPRRLRPQAPHRRRLLQEGRRCTQRHLQCRRRRHSHTRRRWSYHCESSYNWAYSWTSWISSCEYLVKT